MFFRRFLPGEEFEDDPMLVDFNRMDRERQNPPEELQSTYYAADITVKDFSPFLLDLVEFTDEEGYGKFLDMHALHDLFLNLKHMEVFSSLSLSLCMYFLVSSNIRK